METQDIFKQFLLDAKKEISPSSYAVWFNDLELISMDDKDVKIKVPLKLHKDMLRKNYLDFFEETFFSLTGKNYNFEFLTNDEIEEEKDVSNVINEISKPNNSTVEWNTNLNPNLNFDNYVVGESNRLAFTSAINVAQSPGTIRNPLFIYGRSGVGKTHLM